ncbi:GAF domain-containing sensor histidine kinase [Bacillus sp. B-jedd]|uniref:GAF domain-containing sensor histidine kinase n=1 Tax=Bacillus sp. B-jedd TaxID=1476857 RepID=UPI0005156EF6|nr:GAF domain-containing sensor histidine kinase [Bacillus sp. B-jedd]CEG29291.1 sensor histidine kinase domain-containing protein [Bacillus sp. B-jedd]
MAAKGWLNRKEMVARYLMMAISLAGGLLLLYALFGMEPPNEPLILILLVIFLCVIEFYPMPVWRGFTTISFPLVYAIFVMHGVEYAVWSYAFAVFGVNVVRRRPVRIIFFNPAQLVISFYGAVWLSGKMMDLTILDSQSAVVGGLLHITAAIIVFYFINNLLVDLILVVRPQPYTIMMWRQKTLQEGNSLLVSYVYLVLFVVLGNQNRGEIDVITFFFFFAPLVGFALLSSIIVRLRKEKAKLKALFRISSELNKKIASEDWLGFLGKNLPEFIDVDACILWTKQNGKWERRYSAGLVNEETELDNTQAAALESVRHMVIYHNSRKQAGPATGFFLSEIRTKMYAPLMLEDELLGLFVFGRSRTKSFTEDDIQSAVTLANQLAVLLKTKWLFSEEEKRLILEERNRIARDIHDGVAQTLAGAVLNLETAERKFLKAPDDSLKLVHESTDKLRKSLREVRESIYALRPYPTERVGLLTAIQSRIEAVRKEHEVEIVLERRGAEFELSSMTEKVIFDIFQESVQNALKHAKAVKIEIMLSFQRENVFLKIKDNGIGFSLFQAMIKARNEPHFGILHMNEAAEKIKASLQIDSKEGNGTEITLTVPRMGIEGGEVNDQADAGR